MTQFNARLLNSPQLRKIVEICDDLSEQTQLVADALAEYENASEYPADEQREAREQARADVWEAVGEILSLAERLRSRREEVSL